MFATDTAFADLLVVVLPREGPTLEGSPDRRLSIEDDLNLTCVSRATLPPANLTWYINKTPVMLAEWWLDKQILSTELNTDLARHQHQHSRSSLWRTLHSRTVRCCTLPGLHSGTQSAGPAAKEFLELGRCH